MIFHLIILIAVFGGVLGDASTLQNSTVEPETDVSTSKAQSVCDVCSCEDSIVDCAKRGLENHFEDNQWVQNPMVEVNFQENSLVHIKQFPELEINKLILRQNRIVKIDIAAFKNLRNLTELDLSHNQLRSDMLNPHVFEGRFSPESYEPLAKLTVLRLGNNALHTLHQDLFEHVLNLKVLTLDGNPLSVIDHSTTLAISNLPYLDELDLGSCDLDDLPEHIFHTPRYLTKLHLNGNRFTSPPIALEDANALEYVCMDENPITSLDRDNAFPEVPQLKELSLCCMHNMTRIGPGAFSGLDALEVLHMEGCPQLTEIDENALVRHEDGAAVWPPLRTLELADNALRYLPAGLLGRWDKLESLDLSNNEWSCDCKNQYLIGSLLPAYGRLMGEEMSQLVCAFPPEHKGKTLNSLANRQLRCLDIHNARPERDAAILVGVLIGVLLAVPVTLTAFVFWRRGFFFCGAQGPATFSRAFYKRADNDEDF